MKLKTLKNIELEGFSYKDRAITFILQDCISMKVLRQEAIKWIKYDLKYYEIEFGGVAHQIINNWKKRFNITKEDLKS